MTPPRTAPDRHRTFVTQAIATLSQDARLAGVAAAGSWADDTMDEFSDIDLVIAVEPTAYAEVLRDRQRIAASCGPLLASFTGEHVNEPRLLICLYGPPALHVDLKFVSLDVAGHRVDEPAILWERDGRLTRAFMQCEPRYPAPDLQWIEDRFWVWVHYAAAKIARGELFETLEFLSYVRLNVLGPLALLRAGKKPTGVRRIESLLPAFSTALRDTVASHDARACFDAVERCIELYRSLRAPETLCHPAAEAEAMRYLALRQAASAAANTAI